MSMARLALRLVAIEALIDATIAGKQIYDSRMDDISPDLFAAGGFLPTVLVLTDKDEGEQLSNQNGGPPFARNFELTLEIGMQQRVRVDEEQDAAEADMKFELQYADTDAKLEAGLDLLEFQIMRVFGSIDAPLPNYLRSHWRIQKYDSHRQTFDETGVKVACRLIALSFYRSDDVIRTYNAGALPLPTGYDKLPEPLRGAAKLMPVGSNGKFVCDSLVASIDNLTAPQFTGMDVTVDAGNTVPGDELSTEVHATIDVETYPP